MIGAPFYLMEHVDGKIYRDEAELRGARRTGRCTRSRCPWWTPWPTCTRSTRPRSGSADFGRPEGFNARQVRRWKKQLDASRSREVPGIEELHARLAVDIPAGGPGAVVHGDYRLDNVLIGPRLQINAVLDWEMSTLGDPLSDVALMLVYAGLPLQVKDGRGTVPLDVPGHPSLAEMAARVRRAQRPRRQRPALVRRASRRSSSR